jgi:PPOX class probable F420-dependent enzyme
VPIVFVRRGDRLWSPVDGKPKASGQLARIHNVRRNARVSLLLDHYEPDWTRLWWLRIDGTAWVQTSCDPEADPDLAPVVDGLRRKYSQYQSLPLFSGQPTLLGVRIVGMRSWCGELPDLPGLRSCTS